MADAPTSSQPAGPRTDERTDQRTPMAGAPSSRTASSAQTSGRARSNASAASVGDVEVRPPLPFLAAGIALWLGAAASFAVAGWFGTQSVFNDINLAAALVALFVVLGVVLTFFALVILVAGSVRWAVYGRYGRTFTDTGGDPEQIVQLLRVMNARLLLSDTAKRIAYRQEDVNALRRAIKDDVAKGDFDAAMVLVQEMSSTFGYREEAESFREQINGARAKDMERKIDDALSDLEQTLAAHDFEKAGREAAKLQRLYPDSDRVRTAARQVVQAREQYKQQLEREFLGAAERDDLDRAMQLLTELDKYLTEEEAEPFRETARGVIGKRRDNLGVQFKMAVHDKELLRAVQVGEQIIRDFPNTRMADEVRGMLDTLRQRAAEQQAVESRETSPSRR